MTFLCRAVSEHFPVVRDQPAHRTLQLARALSEAVIDTLAAHHRRDAARGPQALVSYYPYETANLVNRALEYLGEMWWRDVAEAPDLDVPGRLKRILPRLHGRLPDQTGRASGGAAYEVAMRFIYEEMLTRLEQARQQHPETLAVKAWKNDRAVRRARLEERRTLITKLLQDLMPARPLEELRARATLAARHAPHKIAGHATLEWAKPRRPELTLSYLLDELLPRARDVALAWGIY